MSQNEQQTMEQVLQAYREGGSASEFIQKLPREQLVALRTHLAEHIEECDYRLWELSRQERIAGNQSRHIREDIKRLHEGAQAASMELYNFFGGIFRDPRGAMQKCWQFEKKYGIERTQVQLHSNPSTFGELVGLALPLLPSFGRRRTALAQVKTFNYADRRKKYDQFRYYHEQLRKQG